mgnify:CR=1 FL=1
MSEFPAMHRSKKEIENWKNGPIKEALQQFIFDIDYIISSNFWFLALQKMDIQDDAIKKEKIFLSDNFDPGPYTTEMTLGDIIDGSKNFEVMFHTRRQIIVSICCAIETLINSIWDSAIDPLDRETIQIPSYCASLPVKRWWVISECFNNNGGRNRHNLKTISNGFSNDVFKRLQKVFYCRNRIVHHNGISNEAMLGYPAYNWGCNRAGGKIEPPQNTIDSIIQGLDNILCHAVFDMYAHSQIFSLPWKASACINPPNETTHNS